MHRRGAVVRARLLGFEAIKLYESPFKANCTGIEASLQALYHYLGFPSAQTSAARLWRKVGAGGKGNSEDGRHLAANAGHAHERVAAGLAGRDAQACSQGNDRAQRGHHLGCPARIIIP